MIKEMVCIVCPNGCNLVIEIQGKDMKVEGAKCKKGKEFAIEEMTAPKRTIATTMKTIFPALPVAPVRINKEILKKDIFKVIEIINKIMIDRVYKVGEVIIENVADTGVDVICTIEMSRYVSKD